MASLALPRPGLLARLATALEEGVLMMGERDGVVRVGAEIESWPVEKKKKLDLPPSSPPLPSLPAAFACTRTKKVAIRTFFWKLFAQQ